MLVPTIVILSMFITSCVLGDDSVPTPFAIEVVDAETGRGVPLVELETVNNQRFVTDSHGLIAFFEPGLMGRRVFFHLRSHGYEFPADGFGYRGKALHVEPGGSARLEIRRINIAERLYRVTGGGIYRDTRLLGRDAPTREPLLNAQVLGQDSVLAVPYRNTIRWFWGDTNRPSYPLGNFHTPGAISELPGAGGLDPAVGVDLTYFLDDDGFARPTARLPGDGPTWLGGLAVVRDSDGRERMFAGYAKIKPPLETYERGLVEWAEPIGEFRKVAEFPMAHPLHPTGHTFQREDSSGQRHVYFTTPLPLTRVPADPAALADPGRYEGFTCLVAGTTFEDRTLDRDSDGRLRYGWKTQTPALSQDQQDELIRDGLMKPEEAQIALRDPESGRAVKAHGGTTYWNEHRDRWVSIFVEAGGESSFLGEVWFAEAEAPEGPWVFARKIVTHDHYSFYNPKHHPFFDQEQGRVIYFEGTYTHTFSSTSRQTPRYDYNQIMYRLNLDDPRLNLPRMLVAPTLQKGIFALDRPTADSVPIYSTSDGHGGLLTREPPDDGASPRFYGLDPAEESPPPTTAPLYEFRHKTDGRRTYSTTERLDGYERSEIPLCRVWINPISLAAPLQ